MILTTVIFNTLFIFPQLCAGCCSQANTGTLRRAFTVCNRLNTLGQRTLRDKGRFPFTKTFRKFLLRISVWEERVPFATSSIRESRGRPGRLKDRERSGTGDKSNKDEKSVNGTQIFHWEVSTGKTGLPFKKIRLFRKISSGTNKKVVFHLYPNRNFRNFLVNGKRPRSTSCTGTS